MSKKQITYFFTIIASVYLFFGCSSGEQKQPKQSNPESIEKENAKKQFQVNFLAYEVEMRKPLAYLSTRMKKFDEEWRNRNIFAEKEDFTKGIEQMKLLCDSLKNNMDSISIPEFYDVGLDKKDYETYLSGPKKKFSEAFRQYSLYYGSFKRSFHSDDTELSKMFTKNGDSAKEKAEKEIDEANENIAHMKKTWQF
ncbi:MAG: hypothetical protein AB7G44_01640 [Bacteroidia bacterium]